MENLKPGLYWAKMDVPGSIWELIEVRYKSGSKVNFVIFHMGWDCSEPISNYFSFVKAELFTPDGEPYGL